jgi:hypothetical protein
VTASGARRLARAASALSGAVVTLLVVPLAVLGAEPSPSPLTGDPRSPGEGPGLVGDPLLAIVGVLLIAIAAVVVTMLWVRLTGGPRTEPRRPPR